MDRQALRAAGQLATIGVHAGDRIALLAFNSVAYVAFVHALTRLGAVLVPLNGRLTTDELTWQLVDVQASLLVYEEHFATQAAAITAQIPSLSSLLLAEYAVNGARALGTLKPKRIRLRTLIDLEATQAIIYTSGTTGQPKGTLITYGMQWWNAIGSALNLGHRPDDRWLACLPFFHIGGLSILFRSVIYGISVIVHERFAAETANRSLMEEGVTIISVVATMVQRMLAAIPANGPEARYPPTFRCLLLGGGPAPRALLEACAARHIPVVQTYGMTESCSQAVTLAPADALRKLGSAGLPLLPVQLRIIQDGRECPAEEPGEIYLRGPTITPGYAGHPTATAQAFHDGWFATGDIGYRDAEGYLYVLDRRSDLIISGGENVYPAEIEAVLLAHPDVAEAGVCGIPDPHWGQVPIAFVHQHAQATSNAAALQEHLAAHVASYKLPQAIYLTGPLPRNATGKLLRRHLLDLLPETEGTDA